ncbi:MAG TPA: glycoside hydrolase domain-containing protein [Terriglobales bacterium]|nr:glycoside hydrolase domain-containing protein [Terriglobales bacterium]
MSSFVNVRVLRGLCFSGYCFLVCAASAQQSYLGFDRNQYPGDQNLKVLRQTFSYAGFWLNNPPGENTNSWQGKRRTIESAGFGFLVLFNGRLENQLRRNPAVLGKTDGQAAAAAALREGFPARAIIFLDIEEGGRMLPQQKAYIYAWVDAVNASGFRAGVYCSGIPAREDKNTTIVTADDIRDSAQGRQIIYWVTNDVCPPSPGCSFSNQPPPPAESKIDFADVWQFAQSPRRPDFAAKCHNYNRDGNCYPPGFGAATHLFVDVNTATSADPSAATTH